MKLLYTDIRTSLTEISTKEAQGAGRPGKTSLYIALTLFLLKRNVPCWST